MICVDPLISIGWKYGKSCHLFTTDNIEKLHTFAKKIGLKRSWFQEDKRLNHYDLTENKRKQAIKNGAIELTVRETVRLFKT